MTKDEMRELLAAALKADDRIGAVAMQGPPDTDAIGAEDAHGDRWWITVEEL